MNKYKIKKIIQSNKLFFYIFECAFSFILARIISEWYLLSRFQSQFTVSYNFLWVNSGYIVSIFLVLWLADWQKTALELINVESKNKINNSSKGIIYSLQLFLYLINVTIISLAITIIFIRSLINDNSISEIVIYSAKEIYGIILTNYIPIIAFSCVLFIKRIVTILNYVSNILFIIIIANTWASNIYLGDHVSRNIISISSQDDILSVFYIIILFVLYKLFLYLLSYHTYQNRLSDWSSVKLSIPLSSHMISLFIPIMFIFLFLTGINI